MIKKILNIRLILAEFKEIKKPKAGFGDKTDLLAIFKNVKMVRG
jgi:hypothetical protein